MVMMVTTMMVMIVMVVTMMVMLCKCDVGKLLDDPVMILRTDPQGGLGSCARLRQGTKSRQLHATGKRKVCQRVYLGLSGSGAKSTLCGAVSLSKSLSARPL